MSDDGAAIDNPGGVAEEAPARAGAAALGPVDPSTAVPYPDASLLYPSVPDAVGKHYYSAVGKPAAVVAKMKQDLARFDIMKPYLRGRTTGEIAELAKRDPNVFIYLKRTDLWFENVDGCDVEVQEAEAAKETMKAVRERAAKATEARLFGTDGGGDDDDDDHEHTGETKREAKRARIPDPTKHIWANCWIIHSSSCFSIQMQLPAMIVRMSLLGYGDWRGNRDLPKWRMQYAHEHMHEARCEVCFELSEHMYQADDETKKLWPFVMRARDRIQQIEDMVYSRCVTNNASVHVAKVRAELMKARVASAKATRASATAMLEGMKSKITDTVFAENKAKIDADCNAMCRSLPSHEEVVNRFAHGEGSIKAHGRTWVMTTAANPQYNQAESQWFRAARRLYVQKSAEEQKSRHVVPCVYPTEDIARACELQRMKWNPPVIEDLKKCDRQLNWMEYALPQGSVASATVDIKIQMAGAPHNTFRIDIVPTQLQRIRPAKVRRAGTWGGPAPLGEFEGAEEFPTAAVLSSPWQSIEDLRGMAKDNVLEAEKLFMDGIHAAARERAKDLREVVKDPSAGKGDAPPPPPPKGGTKRGAGAAAGGGGGRAGGRPAEAAAPAGADDEVDPSYEYDDGEAAVPKKARRATDR